MKRQRKKTGALRAKKPPAPSRPATPAVAFEPQDPRRWYEAGVADGRAAVQAEKAAPAPVLCIDCRWFREQPGNSARFGWCGHPALRKTHLVTGEPEEAYACVERGFYRGETTCGPAAAWFAAKDPPAEGVPEQEGLAEGQPERSEAPLTILQSIRRLFA